MYRRKMLLHARQIEWHGIRLYAHENIYTGEYCEIAKAVAAMGLGGSWR
jgi:hypothetical protein